MVVTLLNWIYIFAVSYILGAFLIPRIALLIDRDSAVRANWCDNVVAGLVVATVYAQLFSLFSGVGIAANAVLIIACAVFIFIDRSRLFEGLKCPVRKIVKDPGCLILALVGLAFFALALMFTAEGTFHYDTGLYHAQAIHWIEDYGIIKGLGLLHVRFAYNSAYFPLCALYSFRDVTGGQSLHGVSGFLFAMMCAYSVYGWIGTVRRRGMSADGEHTLAVSAVIRFAPVFYFFVCLLEITSPESDYITVNLIIWIFIRLAEIYEDEKENEKLAAYCLIGILTFALVGYKLSAAVMAMLVIWPLVILIAKKNIRGVIICGVLAVLMIAPYLIRNVMICGWLVYPVDSIDLFSVPWKFDKVLLTNDAAEIGEWAKSMNVGGSGGASRFGWVSFWWEEQYLATRMFISSMIIALPVMAVTLWGRAKRFLRFLAAVMLMSLVFYLFKAPLIRYCYGPVLVLPLLVIGSMIDSAVMTVRRSPEGHKGRGVAAVIISAAVAGIIMYPSVYSMKELIKFDYEESVARFSFADHIVKQADYPVADVNERDWYGYKVYLPVEGDQCWYSAFPSSPYHECFDANMPDERGIEYGVRKIEGQ